MIRVKKKIIMKGLLRRQIWARSHAGWDWEGNRWMGSAGLTFPAHFLITWISLVAQMVKHLHTIWETWVQSLGWKISWWRKWQPTPVFLPEKSHRWRSLVGYSPWGRKESDTTEWFHFSYHLSGSSNVNVLAIKEWRLECCLKKRASSTVIH